MKLVEGPRRRRGKCLPDAVLGAEGGRFRPRPQSPAAVVHPPVACLKLHRGAKVRQAPADAGGDDRHRASCLQTVEPYPRLALVMHVGADVEFVKVADPRNGWRPPWNHVAHGEGHHADVGFALIGVDFEAGWEGALQLGSVDLPMQKQQLAPSAEKPLGRPSGALCPRRGVRCSPALGYQLRAAGA